MTPEQTTIHQYLVSLPDAALQRVLDAPPWEWVRGCTAEPDGRRCLAGHASDAQWRGECIYRFGYLPAAPQYWQDVSFAFDDLSDPDDGIGLPAAVGWVQDTARAVLAERRPERELVEVL